MIFCLFIQQLVILSKLSPSMNFGFFSICQKFNYDNVNFGVDPPPFWKKLKFLFIFWKASLRDCTCLAKIPFDTKFVSVEQRHIQDISIQLLTKVALVVCKYVLSTLSLVPWFSSTNNVVMSLGSGYWSLVAVHSDLSTAVHSDLSTAVQ